MGWVFKSKWRCTAAVAMLLLPILYSAPAHADTVIYYSAPENSYGWCAGYSRNRAHNCAQSNCASSGGTACEAILNCPDGWGAVARALPPVVGFGASCGRATLFAARAAALAKCMAASNRTCWTDVTFNGNGREASSDSNRQFDMTFFAQAMLQIGGYDLDSADGEFGPRTRAAIKTFQADIGRSPTGDLDDELFRRLLNAVAGSKRVAMKLKKALLDPNEETLRTSAYGYSPTPATVVNYSEELMAWSVEERLMALATLIAVGGGNKCTPPALSGELVGEASGGMWLVACTEGAYQLILSDDGGTVIIPMGATSQPDVQQTDRAPTPSLEPLPEPTVDLKPTVNPEPVVNPEPTVAPETTAPIEAIEQIRTLTDGYEYEGLNYEYEVVRNVGFVPSENLLIIEIDDAQETDPKVAILPLKIVNVISDELDFGEPAIFFRCDPACITIALGHLSEAVEKLSAGRADELSRPEQRGLFAFGCDRDRCTALAEAIGSVVEFARRP
jgi:hypothetical protein